MPEKLRTKLRKGKVEKASESESGPVITGGTIAATEGEVDEEIESAIVRRDNATQIRNISLSKGMKTLREDGWAKVFAGVTSVNEVLRVTEEQ